MTPEKREQIEAVIARLHAEGQAITNDKVYAEIGGNRTSFTAYMRAWRAQQREAGAVAVLEACSPAATADSQDGPDPAEAPVVVRATRTQAPHLVALARAYTEAQRTLEAAQRRVEEGRDRHSQGEVGRAHRLGAAAVRQPGRARGAAA